MPMKRLFRHIEPRVSGLSHNSTELCRVGEYTVGTLLLKKPFRFLFLFMACFHCFFMGLFLVQAVSGKF
jgi:hypothetical protein